jgi:hypothetical protein
MSVDEESGAMYSFQGSPPIIKYYRRSTSTEFQSDVISYDNVSVVKVRYGQIIHGKHLALIVTKTNFDTQRLYFQLHEYLGGEPPKSFKLNTFIEQILPIPSSEPTSFDIDWAVAPNGNLYIATTWNGVYISEYHPNGPAFLTKIPSSDYMFGYPK